MSKPSMVTLPKAVGSGPLHRLSRIDLKASEQIERLVVAPKKLVEIERQKERGLPTDWQF